MECLELAPDAEDIELPPPAEPADLRAATRRLLEEDPARGRELLYAGEWMAGYLWPSWREPLERNGMSRDHFRQTVAGYRHELRLWVVGERIWDHCITGLTGRVIRRL